ncbi:bifunctional isocitrate dehydrogenase kinase/phosphatase [Jeongeupia naejangsanensis]|uniref:Isocitrate dehydrogenase kinase/phosphatase n=1 Tax=Jeongeupia naejangsanensis TaxID=613195 RepID=A0ABS2BJM7_9NEIS|nr:bifunctional isocitrate dehydrogenase kinase/phosphatase [Jeongeupia naejangsanensis]MBM3115817.1 bifunctional isocitrate dehydrogenase kinase/phosphatase [Jeongeupia naejangsanensis]
MSASNAAHLQAVEPPSTQPDDGDPVPEFRQIAELARAILAGFNAHYQRFRTASRAARAQFEAGDVRALRDAVRDRIAFYDSRVFETSEQLKREFDAEHLPDDVWASVKAYFIGLLVNHKQPELAETFFNSVSCRILHRTYFHNDFIFYRPAVSTEYIETTDTPTYRTYYPKRADLFATLATILSDFGWQLPFVDLDRDIRRIARALYRHLGHWPELGYNAQIQVLGSPFFRNKAAYIIGRFVHGDTETPFALPLCRNRDGRLFVDAALFAHDQIRSLFSLSRAYFLVDMEVPSAYVGFLHELIPDKSRAELYTMVGLGKQGKTMFYRELFHHLRHTSDRFEIAPGIRGMVMIVFTLPSFPFVFKLIKDVIPPPKEVNREIVRAKYLMVKRHDRVGRMADSLEFSDVALPRDRFDPALIDELRTLAPSMIEEDGDTIVIRHLYIECRMTPLNVWLDTHGGAELEAKVRDYGNALRELAIANIFPGDMLFKNFGVTRMGRVVFYDYDEIEYMTDCDFRRIPPPPTPEFEMSGEAWYTGHKGEVYPEEFGTFLLNQKPVREAFMKHHADLLQPAFWQQTKARIQAGILEDFFPYPQTLRFAQRYRKA